MCKKSKAAQEELKSNGVNPKKARNATLDWFANVPNLRDNTEAHAWKFRVLEPVIMCQGGSNPRMAARTMMTKSDWSQGRARELLGEAFVQKLDAGWDRHQWFYVILMPGAGRPGVISKLGFRFPDDPKKMDAFQVAQFEKEEKQQRKGHWQKVQASAHSGQAAYGATDAAPQRGGASAWRYRSDAFAPLELRQLQRRAEGRDRVHVVAKPSGLGGVRPLRSMRCQRRQSRRHGRRGEGASEYDGVDDGRKVSLRWR